MTSPWLSRDAVLKPPALRLSVAPAPTVMASLTVREPPLMFRFWLLIRLCSWVVPAAAS